MKTNASKGDTPIFNMLQKKIRPLKDIQHNRDSTCVIEFDKDPCYPFVKNSRATLIHIEKITLILLVISMIENLDQSSSGSPKSFTHRFFCLGTSLVGWNPTYQHWSKRKPRPRTHRIETIFSTSFDFRKLNLNHPFGRTLTFILYGKMGDKLYSIHSFIWTPVILVNSKCPTNTLCFIHSTLS